MSRWVPIAAAAEHVGASIHTLRRWAQEGIVPHGRLAGRRSPLRFDLDALDEWLRARGSTGRAESLRSDDERVQAEAAELAAEIFGEV